jgi:hypothetical protein
LLSRPRRQSSTASTRKPISPTTPLARRRTAALELAARQSPPRRRLSRPVLTKPLALLYAARAAALKLSYLSSPSAYTRPGQMRSQTTRSSAPRCFLPAPPCATRRPGSGAAHNAEPPR